MSISESFNDFCWENKNILRWTFLAVGVVLVLLAIATIVDALIYMARLRLQYNFWRVAMEMLFAVVVNFLGDVSLVLSNAINKVEP